MSDRKLRVAHVLVQPVLVWDDGEELTPFEPAPGPTQVALSALDGLAEKIRDEIAQVSAGQGVPNV